MMELLLFLFEVMSQVTKKGMTPFPRHSLLAEAISKLIGFTLILGVSQAFTSFQINTLEFSYMQAKLLKPALYLISVCEVASTCTVLMCTEWFLCQCYCLTQNMIHLLTELPVHGVELIC